MPYRDVVDLDRYPIDELNGTGGRDLVERCRADLTEHGVSSLPGFLTSGATEAMIAHAGALADQAWRSDQTHTVYFEPPDPSKDEGDPRTRQVRSAKRGIAYDLIPAEAPLRRLYESDDMTRFIAAALGEGVLHRSADPLDAAQITAFHPGEELGWHFDNSEFSVTLMYQQPDAGGEFEYAPDVRDDLDATARVLAGSGDVRTLDTAPGTLALFRGRHALHRVTAVEGSRPRLNSVLTYGVEPGMRLSDLTSQLFYGRTSSPVD